MRKCAVCRTLFEAFDPIEQKYIDLPIKHGRVEQIRPELLNKDEYSCPYCYSADRDRMIIMFINMLHQKVKAGIDFLEIAPSGALQRYLYKYWGESNLYTADLYMDDVDYSIDIQDMKSLGDGTFDFIVCSHVLEHVKDDRKAMRELNRVLAHNGLGIIIVPMDLNRTKTDEAWGLSKEENIRRFGQEDHVRCYCKEDFILRLKESGFGVWELDKSFFTEQDFNDNALTDTSALYLVYKNKDQYLNRNQIICQFNEIYQYKHQHYVTPSGECNYWIDVCDIYKDSLRIWGWFYINELNSKETRFKVMLLGESKKYVWGFKARRREDIQEKFGGAEHNYLFSGIDFLMPISEFDEIYGGGGVYILAENEGVSYIIQITAKMN